VRESNREKGLNSSFSKLNSVPITAAARSGKYSALPPKVITNLLTFAGALPIILEYVSLIELGTNLLEISSFFVFLHWFF